MTVVKKEKTLEELSDILTAQDIADYLKISRRRVYDLFKQNVNYGGIPNFEVGNTKRVLKEDLVKWIVSKRNSKSEMLSG